MHTQAKKSILPADAVLKFLASVGPGSEAELYLRSGKFDGWLPDELLCDPTGALHERLGADRPCLCLVRPDGHLGLRAEPPAPEALHAHLGRIFRSG